MAARPRIGDLYEVKTSKGFAYFQYCHRDASGAGMGPLVRVVEGLYPSRPDPVLVVEKPTLFWVYFPIGGALYHKMIKRVGNLPLPPDAQRYPTLRSPMYIDKGVAQTWAIVTWDEERGEQIVRITRLLTPDEERLSWGAVANFAALVESIGEQSRPENDPLMLRSQRYWKHTTRDLDPRAPLERPHVALPTRTKTSVTGTGSPSHQHPLRVSCAYSRGVAQAYLECTDRGAEAGDRVPVRVLPATGSRTSLPS